MTTDGTSSARLRTRRLTVLLVAGAVLAAGLLVTGYPSDTRLAFGQVAGPGVQDVKLQNAINTLNQPSRPPEDYEEAVDDLMDALFTSNLVVLPTKGGIQGETTDLFNEHQQAMQDAIDALNNHVASGSGGTGNSTAPQMDALDFLLLTQEALQAIGQQAGACNPTGSSCPLFTDDEMPEVLDPVRPSSELDRTRIIRSPFAYAPTETPDPPTEVLSQGPALADGECAPVLKEQRGIATVFRRMQVQIWQAPWFRNAGIVGNSWTWVIEFVPAEHLKTITHCNSGGAITQTVTQQIVLDRGSLSFWRGLD